MPTMTIMTVQCVFYGNAHSPRRCQADAQYAVEERANSLFPRPACPDHAARARRQIETGRLPANYQIRVL